MARKRDLVWDNYYGPHLNGQKFGNNPTGNLQLMTERMYMRHLTELAINRFKWTGLPKSIDARFLELELFRKALAVFFYDEDFARHLALAGSGQGGYNMYDNPTSFLVYGGPKYRKVLKGTECVPIWGNMLRVPDIDIVLVYSKRLAELDRTIQINSKNLRKTRIVYASENTRLSMTNINRQIDEGMEVIYGTEDAMNPANIQVLDLGGDPVGVLNLQIAKSKLWNECMTMLGINNANQDKKERLVADEVAANDDQVFATRGIALNSRQYAADQINEKFKMPDGTPLNISVDFNTDSVPGAMPGDDTVTLGLNEMGVR